MLISSLTALVLGDDRRAGRRVDRHRPPSPACRCDVRRHRGRNARRRRRGGRAAPAARGRGAGTGRRAQHGRPVCRLPPRRRRPARCADRIGRGPRQRDGPAHHVLRRGPPRPRLDRLCGDHRRPPSGLSRPGTRAGGLLRAAGGHVGPGARPGFRDQLLRRRRRPGLGDRRHRPRQCGNPGGVGTLSGCRLFAPVGALGQSRLPRPGPTASPRSPS